MKQTQDFTSDLEQQAERTRTQEINGKKYTIQATDPYGMWHIESKSGPLPASLEGTFTTMDKAWSMILAYETSKMVADAKKKTN